MGCINTKATPPRELLKPKNLFEGEEYELKGEYLPGKKEEVEYMN